MFNLSQTKMEGVTQNRQNQLEMHYFMYPLFRSHFGWSGTTPQMFSLSGTCSEFIFKKDQWMPVIFLRLGIFKIGFEKSYGELKKVGPFRPAPYYSEGY